MGITLIDLARGKRMENGPAAGACSIQNVIHRETGQGLIKGGDNFLRLVAPA
jgi:hypothetical protein